MEKWHEIGAKLDSKKRGMYFRIGAEVQNARGGFYADANAAHADAFAALNETNWKSMKAARCFLTSVCGWTRTITGGFSD